MSGNSQDRRGLRRAVLHVLETAIGFSFPEQHPTSIWEGIFSWPVIGAVVPLLAGIGIGQMLAPIFVPDICFAVAALLVLIKFFSWPPFYQSPKNKIRAASIVVAITFIIVGPLIYWNHKDVPFSFPWLATQESPNTESLLLIIRDYPAEKPSDTVYASIQPLYILRLSVVQFDPQTGYESEIRKIRDDWSSPDFSPGLSKEI
ncbi:MAG: hypothetical protein WA817_16400 [Candidatus Acidiferrum sp.]